MKIYDEHREFANIVIVPREFQPVSNTKELLTIHSGEIEETLQNAGLSYVPPLMLLTPFYPEPEERPVFCIAVQTRRRTPSDWFIQKENLYGLLPVELTEKELVMLYSVLYPKKTPDMEAVNAVLAGQAAALAEKYQKITP